MRRLRRRRSETLSFATKRWSNSILPRISAGDVVGIGIHTGNALRGYEVGKIARARGAWVVFGGIHATLYPEEAIELGGAHSVVKGDGDVIWADALFDCVNGAPRQIYDGGRIEADQFLAARWDLMPADKLYVGICADRARLREALLVLLGLADRRPKAAPARLRRSDPGDRGTAA